MPFPLSAARAKRLSALARGAALLSLSVVIAFSLADAAGGMRLGDRTVALWPATRFAIWCLLVSATAWPVLAWLGRRVKEPGRWGDPPPVPWQWTTANWGWAGILLVSYASAPGGDWLERAVYAASHIGICLLLAWVITRATRTRPLILWVALALAVVLGLGSVRAREAAERVEAAVPGAPPPVP
jgi:hypothetical protein